MFELKALMALFVLASKDGWVQLMYTGLDAVAIDQQVLTLAAAPNTNQALTSGDISCRAVIFTQVFVESEYSKDPFNKI